ncbi:LacI family DNA-binding transcriptional regulator [Gryllotalpicola daejeonensis]|uniref:LacI family DNA-binding transcriptional regulator n=1 Tax=Gryllotalpicola daejeonensis TaxID=993087 RepID=A0ABP7ZP33_9MICO
MAASRGTLADVAKAAGVSVPTVSKVLNGRADVSEATRAKVQQALQDTGYTAKRLQGNDLAGVIDLIIEGVDSPWALEIVRGAEAAAAHRGSAVVVTSSVNPGFDLRSWLDAVAARHSDGVIAALPTLGAEQLRALQELKAPVVVIDPSGDVPDRFATVGATNWAGSFAATERLLELGHTRIGLIAGPSNVPAAVQRLEGYASALRRNGVAFDPRLVTEAEFRVTGGHAAATKLLDLPERPTAIIASSDQQAAGLYEAARERDIRIPSELSVIGFDDTVLSRYLSPALTTVHQPLADMAAEAMRLVHELAANPEARVARHLELATTMIERRSAISLSS